jgi:RNA polymerase sigma-70 factor (ECF subfamily)
MQHASDEVLIGRIANGDRLAMQVLFARHHVRVYRFILRLVRNDATAEDLVSEVFLDVWRQAGKFEGRSAASTWMLSIARFKALSVLRRKGEQELDDATAETIVDDADDLRDLLDRFLVVVHEVDDLAVFGGQGADRLPQNVAGLLLL